MLNNIETNSMHLLMSINSENKIQIFSYLLHSRVLVSIMRAVRVPNEMICQLHTLQDIFDPEMLLNSTKIYMKLIREREILLKIQNYVCESN